MQIKTFSANTTSAVLAQIKEELGPDAIILDTQEEDGVISMTAALERTPAVQRNAAPQGAGTGFEPIGGRPARFQPPAPGNGTFAAPTASAINEANAAFSAASRALQAQAAPAQPQHPAAAQERPAPEAAYAAVPPGWQQWHDEWSSIKTHLLALMKPALRLDLLPPRQRLAIEFLQREGVDDSAVMHLFQRLQGNPAASILAPLAQLVPIRPWSVEQWPQRIQIIAGPFGAGKTSVAVRLALNLRKQCPDCRICLVNADATRGNGRLLLRHYADLSDMAYKEASTTLELVAALNSARREGFDRIIVDLPGLARGRHLATLLRDAGLGDRTGEGPDDIAVHLALPPHYGSKQLQGILARYRTPHAGSIVWTKLDEAEHYGELVNVAAATGLPVSALSFGPGLGNSLAPAKENMLWRLLFKRELPVTV